MRILVALLTSLCLYNNCEAKKYNLELDLKIGDTYQQVYETEAIIIQDLNGQEQKISMEVMSTMSFLVKSADDDSYMMDVKYESMTMVMDMPSNKLVFSSEKKDEDNMFSKIMGAMIDKSFEIKMTRKGKITEVNNIDNMFENAFSQFPNLPEAQKEQMKKQLMDSYGEKSFKGSIETVTYLFPKKPVGIGDEWITKTKLETTLKSDVTTTYVLVKDEGKYWILEGRSVIETEKNSKYEINGMKMSYDMAGNTDIKIKIDKKTGWIVESDINQKMSGSAFIEKNAQLPEGMTIPMEMHNVTSISNE